MNGNTWVHGEWMDYAEDAVGWATAGEAYVIEYEAVPVPSAVLLLASGLLGLLGFRRHRR